MLVSQLRTEPNKPGSYHVFATNSPRCLHAVYPTSDTGLQKTLASGSGLRNANLNLRAVFYRAFHAAIPSVLGVVAFQAGPDGHTSLFRSVCPLQQVSTSIETTKKPYI